MSDCLEEGVGLLQLPGKLSQHAARAVLRRAPMLSGCLTADSSEVQHVPRVQAVGFLILLRVLQTGALLSRAAVLRLHCNPKPNSTSDPEIRSWAEGPSRLPAAGRRRRRADGHGLLPSRGEALLGRGRHPPCGHLAGPQPCNSPPHRAHEGSHVAHPQPLVGRTAQGVLGHACLRIRVAEMWKL